MCTNIARASDGCRVCSLADARAQTTPCAELNSVNLRQTFGRVEKPGGKKAAEFGPVAVAQPRLTRESAFFNQRKVVSMSGKRRLLLDPTGRFVAGPRSSAAVRPPHAELRQLLAPLERICGN